ncbi:hypothetical protein IT411_01970 [Candidatus Peregrinibacteria bacterium]|nr:hypothetical protein [Candidatus Peregrinibacteria bacterium]
MENINTNTLNTAKIIQNNDILKTLRQVSLLFFFVLGSIHILSGLMSSQNLYLPLSNVVNRALDIPFAIIGTVLGLSQAKIHSDSPVKTIYLILMVVVCLLVLGLLLYINLLLPDKI